jgi:hypothetical protein
VIHIAKHKQTKVEPITCPNEIEYILASVVMMPTEYTKFICKNNGIWVVHTGYHQEFKLMFPNAKLQ